MVFNSLTFAVFAVFVYGLYLALNHKGQNRLLLLASGVFYAVWDWRFLFLLYLSVALDWFFGKKIFSAQSDFDRKKFLILSVVCNLSILGFFKYFNFFIASFQDLLRLIGFKGTFPLLQIILPLGISFYIFQSLSYTIDIFRKEIKPAEKISDFALFVTFFPQMVAGPIERAKHLLPQVLSPRTVSLTGFYEGSFLIFWGIFQKVYVADNLAKIVDPVFQGTHSVSGAVYLIALYAFTFQILGDFAGYSDVARGLGRVMGFDIMVNFHTPFFVTNIQEYWLRWHISLSSWIRDYLYLPLFHALRAMKGMGRVYLAVIITMALMGLWHGAAYTFILWGLYYGILLALYSMLRGKFIQWGFPAHSLGETFWKWVRIVFMFHITVLGMLLFRSQSVSQAGIIAHSLLYDFKFVPECGIIFFKFLFFAGPLIIVQAVQYIKGDLMCVLKAPLFIRIPFYVICFYLLIIFGVTDAKEFIYFQF